mgnify:CR=1 FL=1
MSSFYVLASLLFFLATIYVLARANGWSRLQSAFVVLGVFSVPTAALTAVFMFPVPPIIVETVIGLGPVSAMVILFALAKSVANKGKPHL